MITAVQQPIGYRSFSFTGTMNVNEVSAWYHWLSGSTTHRMHSFTHNPPGMPPDWPLPSPVAAGFPPHLHMGCFASHIFPKPIFPSACLIPAVGHVVSYTESNAINVSAPGAAISEPGRWTHWTSRPTEAHRQSFVSTIFNHLKLVFIFSRLYFYVGGVFQPFLYMTFFLNMQKRYIWKNPSCATPCVTMCSKVQSIKIKKWFKSRTLLVITPELVNNKVDEYQVYSDCMQWFC